MKWNRYFSLIAVLFVMVAPAWSGVLLEENFDAAAALGVPLLDHNTGQAITDPQEFTTYQPENWKITSLMRPETDSFNSTWAFPCFSAQYYGDWVAQADSRGTEAPGFDLGIMAADSDAFGGRGFQSWLDSPIVNTSNKFLTIEFDNFYEHNDNQAVSMEITWDGGQTYNEVLRWDDSNRQDNTLYVTHEKVAIEKPTAATSFGLRFRYFGSGAQDGFADDDWFWAFDNLKVSGEDTLSMPAKPTINPPGDFSGVDNIQLTSSAISSAIGATLASAVWEVALDSAFSKLLVSTEITDNPTTLAFPNYRVPLGKTVYARVTYKDSNGLSSPTSDMVSFKMNPPAGVKRIFYEDFESTADHQIPAGWTQVDFNDPGAATDPNGVYSVWGVVGYDELAAQGANRVNVAVMNGKSCYHESDRIGPYEEAHLFTPYLDLSKVKNVILTFGSNYMQNQDNIGTLEYAVDGGSLSASGDLKGHWLPIAYLMDDQNKSADIKYNADGSIDAQSTFSGIADGTSFAYGDLALASQSGMSFEDMAPYLSGRINDNSTESKRFESYRLDKADNQAKVIISWMNMGTGSWFWAIDDVAIWGDDGTDVSDWSLY